MTKRPHPGRPSVKASPGERSTVSLRLTAEAKDKLEAAAWSKGRPFSHEAEYRLERSFEKESLLPDVLSLAFDPLVAGVLMSIGTVMMAVRLVRNRSPRMREQSLNWNQNPTDVDTAILAAMNLLSRMTSQPPEIDGHLDFTLKATLSESIVVEAAQVIQGSNPHRDGKAIELFGFQHLQSARTLLGELASRIDIEGPRIDWEEGESQRQENSVAEDTKSKPVKTHGKNKKSPPKR